MMQRSVTQAGCLILERRCRAHRLVEHFGHAWRKMLCTHERKEQKSRPPQKAPQDITYSAVRPCVDSLNAKEVTESARCGELRLSVLFSQVKRA